MEDTDDGLFDATAGLLLLSLLMSEPGLIPSSPPDLGSSFWLLTVMLGCLWVGLGNYYLLCNFSSWILVNKLSIWDGVLGGILCLGTSPFDNLPSGDSLFCNFSDWFVVVGFSTWELIGGGVLEVGFIFFNGLPKDKSSFCNLLFEFVVIDFQI